MSGGFRVEGRWFDSGGEKCAADLYTPMSPRVGSPCLVMGHGFSGTKDFAIPVFARRFAQDGFFVLAFDYRGFGESEGKLRQVVDVKLQREDFRAAVEYARSLEGVDPGCVAVWGSSLAGGHVLDLASEDPDIAAVITQVPFIDAFKGGGSERAPVDVQVRLLWAAVSDLVRGWLGLRPLLVPVVGDPGSFATMTEPDAKPAVEQLVAEGSTWRNEFAPRVAFGMPRYRAGTVEGIEAPVLLCVAEHDSQASPEFAIETVGRAKNVEIARYPVGHFALYVGEMRERVIEEQLAFLRRHLACR